MSSVPCYQSGEECQSEERRSLGAGFAKVLQKTGLTQTSHNGWQPAGKTVEDRVTRPNPSLYMSDTFISCLITILSPLLPSQALLGTSGSLLASLKPHLWIGADVPPPTNRGPSRLNARTFRRILCARQQTARGRRAFGPTCPATRAAKGLTTQCRVRKRLRNESLNRRVGVEVER